MKPVGLGPLISSRSEARFIKVGIQQFQTPNTALHCFGRPHGFFCPTQPAKKSNFSTTEWL